MSKGEGSLPWWLGGSFSTAASGSPAARLAATWPRWRLRRRYATKATKAPTTAVGRQGRQKRSSVPAFCTDVHDRCGPALQAALTEAAHHAADNGANGACRQPAAAFGWRRRRRRRGADHAAGSAGGRSVVAQRALEAGYRICEVGCRGRLLARSGAAGAGRGAGACRRRAHLRRSARALSIGGSASHPGWLWLHQPMAGRGRHATRARACRLHSQAPLGASPPRPGWTARGRTEGCPPGAAPSSGGSPRARPSCAGWCLRRRARAGSVAAV